MTQISLSLRKLLANGRLRQNSLAIANAMAWCTQYRTTLASPSVQWWQGCLTVIHHLRLMEDWKCERQPLCCACGSGAPIDICSTTTFTSHQNSLPRTNILRMLKPKMLFQNYLLISWNNCRILGQPLVKNTVWITCRRILPVNFARIGFGKRGLLEKGSFQKSPFSRDSREFRDSRDFRGPPDCGKQRRIQPFSRDSREI